MRKSNITVFDKTELYESTAAPLVKKLAKACRKANIPFVFCACVANNDEGTEYRHEMLPCGSRGIRLTDDRITKYFNILTAVNVYGEDDNVRLAQAARLEIDMDELFPGPGGPEDVEWGDDGA